MVTDHIARVVVPVDRSDGSLRALRPAAVLADAVGAELVAATVVATTAEREPAEAELADRLAATGVEVSRALVEVNSYTVEQGLESLTHGPEVLVVIATAGHSRGRPLIGSVAEELVHSRPGRPTILVGPRVDPGRFDLGGPMVLCVDPERPLGSGQRSARRLAARFGMEPRPISVLPAADAPHPRHPWEGEPTAEAGAGTAVVPPRLADSHVDYCDDPSQSIIDYAASVGASLIAVGTRQRVGLSRLVFGSVAIRTVSEAVCPVLTIPVRI